MIAADVSEAFWRKSSRSGSDSNCVEVADMAAATAVRDSKDRDGPVLAFTPAAWTSFITAVRTNTLR